MAPSCVRPGKGIIGRSPSFFCSILFGICRTSILHGVAWHWQLACQCFFGFHGRVVCDHGIVPSPSDAGSIGGRRPYATLKRGPSRSFGWGSLEGVFCRVPRQRCLRACLPEAEQRQLPRSCGRDYGGHEPGPCGVDSSEELFLHKPWRLAASTSLMLPARSGGTGLSPAPQPISRGPVGYFGGGACHPSCYQFSTSRFRGC